MKRDSWLALDVVIPILAGAGIILLSCMFDRWLNLDTNGPAPLYLAGDMFWLAGIASVIGIPVAVIDLVKGSKVRGVIGIVLIILTWPLAYFLAALVGIAMA